MKPELQRIAIAEACGWKREKRRMYAGAMNVRGWGKNQHLSAGHPNRLFVTTPELFPDYLNDLNAMHKAEMVLDADADTTAGAMKYRYAGFLYNTTVPLDQQPCRATAAQRAEALLRTLNLWRDE